MRKEAAHQDVVISVKGLCNRFGGHEVHTDLNLDLYHREILGVVGGSGTGKSVLLRSIVGLHTPDSGTIEVFGEQLQALSQQQRSRVERRFGVLFQSGALFSSLTLQENVALPLIEHAKLSRTDAEHLARVKLALVGLPANAAGKYPAQLSGGMVKRASLARALALDPEVLFLDEPTAGLDPVMTAIVDELTNTLTRKIGATVVVVTHDIPSAFRIATRMIMLGTGEHQGKVVIDGTPEEVKKSDHPAVVQFIEGRLEGPATEALRNEGYREALLS